MSIPRIAFIAFGLAGCSNPPHAGPDAPVVGADATSDGRSGVLTIKAVQNPDLDILFLIDDSPSMADKQNNLKLAFPSFEAALQGIAGGLPNLHIGVATSDMGTKGSAVLTPGPAIGGGPGGCSGTGKNGVLQANGVTLSHGNYLEALRGGSQNFTGDLPTAFSAIASVGQAGCGFEQHLAGVRAALNENAANTGFLRDSANLAVIVLADEDDCSALDPAVFQVDPATYGPLNSFRCFRFGVTCDQDSGTDGDKTGCHASSTSPVIEDVAPFQQFLLGLKHGDARKLLLGAIVAPATPATVEERALGGTQPLVTQIAHSCNYTDGNGQLEVGDPAVRLTQLVSGFPGRHFASSVCQALQSPAAELGAQVAGLVGDGCLEQTIATPVDCVVEDISDAAPSAPVNVPSCGAGVTGDCYTLTADNTCTVGAPLRLSVTRAAPAGDDVWTTVRCTR